MKLAANSFKISVITPFYSRDRFKDVTEMIDSVQIQNYKNIETIIVTERSPELAESVKDYVRSRDYANVLVLYNEGEWGSYSARNLGVTEASGDIMAFADDDALLFPDWADETVKAYAGDSSIIGLTGPILPLWEDASMSWFPREFYWVLSCTYWNWDKPTEVRNGYGTNISFRREAFERCGYFKSNLEDRSSKSDWQQPAAEETEFSLRVTSRTGKRIVYHPNIKVKHKVYQYRLSSSFIRRRAYWEGYAKAILNERYRNYAEKGQVLTTEYELLRHIFVRFLPDSIKLFFRKPGIALRRLWVCLLILSLVATGYASYTLHNLLAFRRQG